MYTTIILGSALVIVGSLLSFIKEMTITPKVKKTHSALFFSISTLIMGLIGATLGFVSSKNNIDQKVVSDSTAAIVTRKNDSLTQNEINLLGGGNMKPLLAFLHYSPTSWQFFIMDTSKYTLRDISVNIRDNNALKAFQDKAYQQTKDSAKMWQIMANAEMVDNTAYTKVIGINYLTPGTRIVLETLSFDLSKANISYEVNVFWSGGNLTYYINCKNTVKGWVESRKVYDRITGITTNESEYLHF